ncbi:hypothetical protein AAZV13_09G212700 [Glycine max]
MSITTGICQVVAVSLLLGSLSVYSLECDDDRCKTWLCNSTGACTCNLPDPSTILNGDRTFLGGTFCDEEMTMCDGTNSFWCEHGATCEEIVQGEKYSCKCPPGFAGEHCEHSGASCGQTFCFHNAECLAEAGDVCQCPSEWKGSADCSLPTTPTVFYSNSSDRKSSKVSSCSDSNVSMTQVLLRSSCSYYSILQFDNHVLLPSAEGTGCLGSFFSGSSCCWCHLWQETVQQEKKRGKVPAII